MPMKERRFLRKVVRHRFMRRAYDLLLFLYFLLMLPVFAWKVWKGKYRKSLAKRFFPDLNPGLPCNGQGPLVWVHAVSVGEAGSIRSLLGEIKTRVHGARILVTTVTETGQEFAEARCGAADATAYLPMDFSFCVRRFFDLVRPAVLVVAETEIWPNLFWEASEREIPVVVVNGRISDRTASTYERLSSFFGPVLDAVRVFLMQDETGRDRIVAAGARPSRVVVNGNIKFDSLPDIESPPSPEVEALGRGMARPGRPLVVVGSTHPGEEEVVLGAVRSALPGAPVILAPRHPERARGIAAGFAARGMRVALRSELNETPTPVGTGRVFDGAKEGKGNPPSTRGDSGGLDLLIVDTIGELADFYKVCDIAVVGGSMVPIGGHNILEPAACGKPVLWGPHMHNFRAEADLLEGHGGTRVADGAELEAALGRLAEGGMAEELRASEGQKALKRVSGLRGASARAASVVAWVAGR